MQREARFSQCGLYRYTLDRRWGPGAMVTFVLLNPSTADAQRDDPTNRRGVGFARDWGFDACSFVNLFAYRSPHPSVLRKVDDPIGPENDAWIRQRCHESSRVVVGWGIHGVLRGRDVQVLTMLWETGVRTFALGTTKGGFPRHPLYLRKRTRLVRYLAENL